MPTSPHLLLCVDVSSKERKRKIERHYYCWHSCFHCKRADICSGKKNQPTKQVLQLAHFFTLAWTVSREQQIDSLKFSYSPASKEGRKRTFPILTVNYGCVNQVNQPTYCTVSFLPTFLMSPKLKASATAPHMVKYNF